MPFPENRRQVYVKDVLGQKRLVVSVEEFVEQAVYGSFAFVGSGIPGGLRAGSRRTGCRGGKLGEGLRLFHGRRFFLDGGSFLHRALLQWGDRELARLGAVEWSKRTR